MAGRVYTARKTEYFNRLKGYFGTYTRVFVVNANNVGSFQIQQVRMAFRGIAEVIFGKNTMMRKVLDQFMGENPGHPMASLKEHMQGNVGLIFTNDPDLGRIKDIIVTNIVPAPARSGSIAPVKVVVPAGNTGMDPGQTAFFQALNIATKITRGLVEIINDVNLIEIGERVSPGQAALLKRLDIQPFSYGLSITRVYDNGACFDPKVLMLTTEVLEEKFMGHVSSVSALCMEIGWPTLASLPHMVSTNFQLMASVALEVGYEFSALTDKIGSYAAAPAAEAAPAE
jgi:large subunit ribosomal protein LP0